MTPIYNVSSPGVAMCSVDGSILSAKTGTKSGVDYCYVTASDGTTSFSQRFGIAVTSDATGIEQVWSEDGLDIVKREFFTLDGRQVNQMRSHEVYLMKTTDADGNVRTVKILKN